MKKTLLTLAIAMTSYYSYAQNIFPSSGNVGIGMTSPSFPLTVQGTTGQGIQFTDGTISNMIGSYSGAGFIGTTSNTPLAFWTNNTERIRIAASGSVGIGTASPGLPLQVHVGSNQNLGFDSNGSVARISTVNDALSSNPSLAFQATDYTFYGNSGVGPYLTVNSSGNVGMGTTSPTTMLDVVGAGTFSITSPSPFNTVQTPLILSNGAGNGGAGAQVNFSVGSATSYINSVIDGANSLSGSALTFGTPSTGVIGTERMRISSAGNVLIGKTSQTNTGYILDVNGNVRSNQIVVNTTGADFVFNPTYKLPELSLIKTYIDQNHHLPGVPTAETMQKDGLNVGDINTKLLQKVEELTLYMIEKDKQVKEQEARIAALEAALAKLTANSSK